MQQVEEPGPEVDKQYSVQSEFANLESIFFLHCNSAILQLTQYHFRCKWIAKTYLPSIDGRIKRRFLFEVIVWPKIAEATKPRLIFIKPIKNIFLLLKQDWLGGSKFLRILLTVLTTLILLLSNRKLNLLQWVTLRSWERKELKHRHPDLKVPAKKLTVVENKV